MCVLCVCVRVVCVYVCAVRACVRIVCVRVCACVSCVCVLCVHVCVCSCVCFCVSVCVGCLGVYLLCVCRLGIVFPLQTGGWEMGRASGACCMHACACRVSGSVCICVCELSVC